MVGVDCMQRPMLRPISIAPLQKNGAELTIPSKKRTALACNGCRVKRVKCDGREPQCDACFYRREECKYNKTESKPKRPSNAYVQALEARIKGLEQLLALGASKSIPSPPAQDYDDISPNRDEGIAQVPLIDLIQPNTNINDGEIEELTDALGCFTIGDAGELRFFGASSNFNLIQNPSLRVASSLEARNLGFLAARQAPDFYESSEELRDHLLSLFWRWQNSWNYIVAREPFAMDLYVYKSGRFCTPLLLNAMLAYACRFSDRTEVRTDPKDANTAGEIFAQQAKTMLHYEYEAPTTSTVQAATLLGLYWGSVDREGLGFMYIGMASRMAMNLGLHCDSTIYAERGAITEEDAEARNVAFWGIYVLDKLFCLGMGRPAGIQEYNITTPKPKEEDPPLDCLTKQQLSVLAPWPTSHITRSAAQTCDILLLTSEIVDQLYAQRPIWTEHQRTDRIMQTHTKLAAWLERLPKDLKMSESSLQPSAPYVYQLHLQYHMSMILLHRPFLRMLHSGKRSTGDFDPEGKDIHSRSCKTSAVKITNIFRVFRDTYSNRCMPLSAVHPCFTAAIIHLLDYKSTDAVGQSRAMRLLRICVQSLYEMNINWDWANRSIRAIQSLANQWGIKIFTSETFVDIAEESLMQFQRYEKSCVSIPTASRASDLPMLANDELLPNTFDEFFDFWTCDGVLDGAFNFHNGL